MGARPPFIKSTSFLGQEKTKKTFSIFNQKMVNLFQDKTMTDRPTYPIILTDNTTGYLDLIDNGDYLANSNALGLIKQVQKNF